MMALLTPNLLRGAAAGSCGDVSAQRRVFVGAPARCVSAAAASCSATPRGALAPLFASGTRRRTRQLRLRSAVASTQVRDGTSLARHWQCAKRSVPITYACCSGRLRTGSRPPRRCRHHRHSHSPCGPCCCRRAEGGPKTKRRLVRRARKRNAGCGAAHAARCALRPAAAAVALAAALLLYVTQDSVTPVRNALAARVGACVVRSRAGAELAATA
jgi:hypothetical protein